MGFTHSASNVDFFAHGPAHLNFHILCTPQLSWVTVNCPFFFFFFCGIVGRQFFACNVHKAVWTTGTSGESFFSSLLRVPSCSLCRVMKLCSVMPLWRNSVSLKCSLAFRTSVARGWVSCSHLHRNSSHLPSPFTGHLLRGISSGEVEWNLGGKEMAMSTWG